MMTAQERLLRYVAYDTTSDENSETCPSSERQWALIRLIEQDMRDMGVGNVRVSEHGYVYGELPANTDGQPVIGLIAHMDTSDAVPGGPVRARTVHFDGSEIVLNAEKGIRLMPEKRHLGQDLIVTDGTTLLGADDKAGVSEILTLCEELIAHPERKHGRICIGFTPDEEIGRGADLFDIPDFGADFAYTLDGAAPEEIEAENFNAASARVTVHGLPIHPGSAKNRMRNASTMAMEFHGMLPANETPECTEGREGFYHLTDMQGETVEARLSYIIRDHDRASFEKRKERMRAITEYLNQKYGENTFELQLRDSYYNMLEKVMQRPDVLARAENAIRAAGLKPEYVAIRGGTDGARLSFEGLICPNLGTGGCNFHGVYEYASVQEMDQVMDILRNLVTVQ